MLIYTNYSTYSKDWVCEVANECTEGRGHSRLAAMYALRTELVATLAELDQKIADEREVMRQDLEGK